MDCFSLFPVSVASFTWFSIWHWVYYVSLPLATVRVRISSRTETASIAMKLKSRLQSPVSPPIVAAAAAAFDLIIIYGHIQWTSGRTQGPRLNYNLCACGGSKLPGPHLTWVCEKLLASYWSRLASSGLVWAGLGPAKTAVVGEFHDQKKKK